MFPVYTRRIYGPAPCGRELYYQNRRFSKILDNFEVVEEFFGRPLKTVFLEGIAKKIASGNRKQVCEFRVAKDYEKNSFALVFKNGIPPEVKSFVVARTPDEVPKFLGRLMLLGTHEKDWDR